MFTPAFLARQTVLVIGGGKVVQRRVKILLEAGANIRVIAPTVTSGLAELASNEQIEWLPRPWLPGDVRDFPEALLVFAATDEPTVNAFVAKEARQAGRLVNRADKADECDFTVPGVVRSGEITLAVSTGVYSPSEETGGASPALTARLRRKLAETVGPEYSLFSRLLRELRPRVKLDVSPDRRQVLWKRLAESEALELLRQGRETEARQLLESYLREEVETSHEELY